MSSVQCLINGVILREVTSGRCRPGDLFSLGDCYIVNATKYQYTPNKSELDEVDKIVEYTDPGDYFERREVFVFQRDQLTFNAAAQDYISRGIR